MGCMIRRFIPLLLAGIVIAIPCLSDDYSQLAGDAVSKIELGKYDEAASLIGQILAQDDSDLLGRTALATAYLHTNQLADAQSEFQYVISHEPDDPHARYALGLIALLRKQPADAEKQFSYLDKFPEARADLSALRAYLAFVNGKPYDSSLSAQRRYVLSVEITAMSALKSGKREDAVSRLSDVLSLPSLAGFEEIRSPVATFDPKQPIGLPGGKFIRKTVQRKDIRGVSGVVTLYADTNKVSGVSFVSLYVDDKCAAITNCDPYSFAWDTSEYSNGLHHVRIEAKSQGGNVLSSKSVWVKVANDGQTAKNSAEIERLNERLWNCIRLNGSRKLAHYQLAKLYLESGDRESAAKNLESTVAYDPGFRDARKLLNDLRGWKPSYVEVTKGPPGSKMIALTFDDGPNERTAEMLDVLAKLKIAATFFVVGFRAELQPELIKAMASAGHEIENHSYTHANLTTLNADQVEVELSRCAAAIDSITGRVPRYFRPPGGHANAAVKTAASRQGFTGIFWTILCSPYEGAKYDSMTSYVIKNACDGAIVLMHNGDPIANSSLPEIVGELRKRGYRFVTLTELLNPANG